MQSSSEDCEVKVNEKMSFHPETIEDMYKNLTIQEKNDSTSVKSDGSFLKIVLPWVEYYNNETYMLCDIDNLNIFLRTKAHGEHCVNNVADELYLQKLLHTLIEIPCGKWSPFIKLKSRNGPIFIVDRKVAFASRYIKIKYNKLEDHEKCKMIEVDVDDKILWKILNWCKLHYQDADIEYSTSCPTASLVAKWNEDYEYCEKENFFAKEVIVGSMCLDIRKLVVILYYMPRRRFTMQTIQLISEDNQTFEVDLQSIIGTQTITKKYKELSEQEKKNPVIHLKITGRALKIILGWCEHHKDDNNASFRITTWDREYFEKEERYTQEIVNGADYLENKKLIDILHSLYWRYFLSFYISETIKKSRKQVKSMYNQVAK